ncbi:hypothetical protein D9M71_829480 [compost metagenome]
MAISPLNNSNGKNTVAHSSSRNPVSRIGSIAWLTFAAAENEAATNKAQSSMPTWAAAKPVVFMGDSEVNDWGMCSASPD